MKDKAAQNSSNFSQEYRVFFDDSSAAIIVVNPTGKILNANRSACSLIGCEKNSLVKKTFSMIFPEYAGSQGGFDLNNLQTMETFLLTQKGLRIPVEITRIQHSQDNGITDFILLINDVSKLRLADTLRDIATTLTASLNINEVYDLLLVQLSRLIPYDGGNVMTINGREIRISRTHGYQGLKKKLPDFIKNTSFNLETTYNINEIIKTRKPLIISNTHVVPEWSHNIISENYKSWMGAPVIIDGKIDVIFSLDKIEEGFFTEEHASLLTSFSNLAALAIKNARMFSAETRRIQELDALQDTLSSINLELDLNTLLKEIVERAIQLLHASVGELALYDSSENLLKLLVSQNLHKEFIGNDIEIGEGVMGKAAELKKPVNVDSYIDFPEHQTDYEFLGNNAGLAVPMMAGKNLIGVLSVGSIDNIRKFDESDIRLLNSFAQQATIAIQNARLFEDAKRRAEEAETLHRVGAAVASTLDQAEAINLILEQLALVVPYDSASVLLRVNEKLVIVGDHGFKNSNPVKGLSIPLDEEHPGAIVFLEKKALIINDIEEKYPNFNDISHSEVTIKSWLGVPLTIQDRTIGILSLDSYQLNQFTEEHSRLVSAFANQVSIALENAKLYTDMVRSANQFETLYRLSQVIGANIRSEEIYPAIHEAVSQLMTTEFFSISLYDEKTQMIQDVYMMDSGVAQPLSSRPLGAGLFSTSLKEGKSFLFNSFNAEMFKETGALLVGDLDEDECSQSILVVPLMIGNTRIGVLSAQSYLPNVYSESDREMLELLAANVAIALENAKLFSEIQEMAITDPLTKLFNRRKFYELGVQEFERSRRYKRPLCVIMLDLDLFKNVNDTYGHMVGDQVLMGLAELCKKNLRTIDILARYGGEEFVVILPETTAKEALVIAERLRQDTEMTPIHSNAGDISIAISLGVVAMDTKCKNLEELLDRSDQALYVSKRNGRNRTTLWKPEFKSPPIGFGHTQTQH